jgi:hypothetical protein
MISLVGVVMPYAPQAATLWLVPPRIEFFLEKLDELNSDND